MLTLNGIAMVKSDSYPSVTLQVLKIKAKETVANCTKHMVVLSDGVDCIQGFFNSNVLNSAVRNNEILVGSIIKLVENEYTYQQMAENKYRCSIDDASIEVKGSSSIIGNPSDVDIEDMSIKIVNTVKTPSPIKKKDYDLVAIADINPHRRNMRFKGKIYSKILTEYKNARGQGKIGKLVFKDEIGSKIQLVMFTSVVDKYFDKLVEDSWYMVSDVMAKPIDEKFNKLSHPYELSATNSTTITLEEVSVEEVPLDFTAIAILSNRIGHTDVNVLGVVQKVGPLENKAYKDGKAYSLRVITLIDQSEASVEITVFGTLCQLYDEEKLKNNPVLMIESVKCTDFNTVSLSANNTTKFVINPSTKEAKEVRAWFATLPSDMTFSSLTESRQPRPKLTDAVRCSLEDFSAMDVHVKQYRSVKATILYINDDMLYMACPNTSCKKKMECQEDVYKCHSCDTYASESGIPSFNLSIHIVDETTSRWVNLFNETSEKLLGITAVAMHEKKTNNDSTGIKTIIDKAIYEVKVFLISVAISKNDSSTKQFQVEDVENVNSLNELMRVGLVQ